MNHLVTQIDHRCRQSTREGCFRDRSESWGKGHSASKDKDGTSIDFVIQYVDYHDLATSSAQSPDKRTTGLPSIFSSLPSDPNGLGTYGRIRAISAARQSDAKVSDFGDEYDAPASERHGIALSRVVVAYRPLTLVRILAVFHGQMQGRKSFEEIVG